MEPIQVRKVSPEEAPALIHPLAVILKDCVEGGASVNFLLPFDLETGIEFWTSVFKKLETKDRLLLVAEQAGEVIGTVQILFAPQPNQPHRVDLVKLLVHSKARRQGVGEKLMLAAEKAALEHGRTLLILDTERGGSGDRLYPKLGWVRFGEVPDYALSTDGKLVNAVFYYKLLKP